MFLFKYCDPLFTSGQCTEEHFKCRFKFVLLKSAQKGCKTEAYHEQWFVANYSAKYFLILKNILYYQGRNNVLL